MTLQGSLIFAHIANDTENIFPHAFHLFFYYPDSKYCFVALQYTNIYLCVYISVCIECAHMNSYMNCPYVVALNIRVRLGKN